MSLDSNSNKEKRFTEKQKLIHLNHLFQLLEKEIEQDKHDFEESDGVNSQALHKSKSEIKESVRKRAQNLGVNLKEDLDSQIEDAKQKASQFEWVDEDELKPPKP